MRKRKRIITEAGHEDRWLVSYADFITLLFAFFVVMYSISSLNEAKYKSLMHSIGSAFSNKSQPVNGSVPEQIPLRTPAALESVPDLTQAQAPEKSTLPNTPEEQEEAEKKRRLSEEIIKEQKQLKQVSEQLKAALEPFVDANLVSVINNDFWVTLQMNSELLFASGAADVSKKSIPIIQKIAEVIGPMANAVNVEGHTDNVPIATPLFRSNWDLSSARATSVVLEFAKAGIDPSRLSAVGYGEYHPIADNTTEEGRFKNRRVLLVLMSKAFSRYGANDEQRAKLLNLERPIEHEEAEPVSETLPD